ncbi:MAG: transporter substrate-binding domain-containing protein [Streptococcaceae bacterium]|jgi:polar amino acid transport system substrate-binding protein|nr:transporter substrate-binding domain-containing protein [Streptococcaceae bacterium]
MKGKKFLIGIVAALSLIGLAACSGSSTNSLKKIQDKGTLVVATAADFAPYEYQTVVNGKNTIVGSDIDMANEIGKELGVKVKFENMDFNNVLTAVQSGKTDIAISGISNTPDREKSFDFSTNYYNGGNVVVVKKSEVGKYTSVASLAGKQVTAQKGSIQEGIVTDQLKKATEVALTDTNSEISEVQGGQVAAAVLDEVVAKQYVMANSDLAIAKIPLKQPTGAAGMAIAMPKDSGALKTKIDSIVQKLIKNGTIQKEIDDNIAKANAAAKK